MALSVDSLDGKLRAALIAGGVRLDGVHARSQHLARAVAVGTVGEINATAIVLVPTHAGGTYSVTGLSQSGMNQKIKGSLSGAGFTFGNHSRANVINDALSEAITSHVLANCQVTIPYDGSGEFSVTGMNEAALRGEIIQILSGHGFNVARGDSSIMATAVAKAVTNEVNAAAVVRGSFAGGGAFPVL